MSGHWGGTCGSRCRKEPSSQPPSIAAASIRCSETPPASFGPQASSAQRPRPHSHRPLSALPLSQMILERRGHGRLSKETGLGGGPPTPEPEAQLPSGSPALNSGRRPRNNPGLGPVHGAWSGGRCVGPPTASSAGLLTPGVWSPDPTDAPGGAQDPPRQNSAPLHQPPPPGGPGKGAGPGGATSSSWVGRGGGAAGQDRSRCFFTRALVTLPLAPPQVKPGVREAAPSLASQAAAQVAVRALIRSDRNPGRGANEPGAPRVSPCAPLPAPRPPSFPSAGRSLRGPRFWSLCRFLLDLPGRPGPVGGCSGPRPHRGPREPRGPRWGATPKPTGPSASRRWAACPSSRDLAPEPPCGSSSGPPRRPAPRLSPSP